jgi:hypothetical protein
VAVFGSLILTSSAAKKRTLLLLAIVAMGLPWFTWYAYNTNPGKAPLPGPGALVLPVAALVLFLIARVQQWNSGALIVLCILGMQIPPLARGYHPMMMETMEHEFIEPERQRVLLYLKQHYHGERILIDMGTEAPLVYDSGLAVKEFVYNEGGETAWHEAVQNPEPVVGWLCAQKGDGVWKLIQRDPNWAKGYSLAMSTKNYRLYKRKQ